MKNLLICCFLFISFSSFGQSPFSDCVAACLDKVAIVDSYNKGAVCEIQSDASGKLAVYTVGISEKAITPRKKIKFKVAIKDAATQTIWSFSESNYEEVSIEKILSSCKKGDSIILMTVDNTYALPHHEILVR